MRYILIFILILVYSQEVIYQIEAANYPGGLDVDQWFIIGNDNGLTYTFCNGVDVYGGYGSFTHDTIIQKAFFDLQPHFQIKVEINLLLFGLTLGEFKIENDNNEIFIVSPASPLIRSCSENSIEYQLQSLDFEFPHQRRNYIFKMFQAYYDNTFATWGFDSFKISIYKCPFGCLQCLGYDDLNCGFWSKLQFSFIQCQLEDTDIQQWGGGSEYNVDEFGRCQGINSISLENSFLLPPSDDILIRFLINKNTDLTIWINENRIDIQQQGVIEISLQKQFGPTLNIKIRDLNNFLDWMIRDLEIYYKIRPNYIENEIIIPYIILECMQFADQFCLDCREGWELNILQNICVTQCGDNIISGFEECDDGNQIQYDGCYMCKFQCIQFCQICIHGICMLCLNGYSFNNNQECSLNCEDKIIIPQYNEECSGENFLQFHGCFQCLNYEECTYGCVKCDHQICYQCQSDFILIQGRCLSNCGRNDEILYEDCEDFNEENNIELLCPLYCIECNLQQCLICDEQYELLEGGSCKLNIDDDLDNIYQLIQKDDMICRKIPFECNYQKSPQVNLSYINITLNKQYVNLEFTEQVKSESQKLLSQTLIIEIFNISNKIFR
ncbi:unnamed protein product [Paramecium pentaurelia]|uniref:Insulin-like growth factor binding protein, N-terminal n=1 Tax=Paramecium pentaurelia TaxID=43138 RepID=A0A8S1YBT2_9CILI|nr:unnamed protein product [Paramecium pentaurelia]